MHEQPEEVGEAEVADSIKPNILITLSEEVFIGYSADVNNPILKSLRLQLSEAESGGAYENEVVL